MRTLGKRVSLNRDPGFESLPIRHSQLWEVSKPRSNSKLHPVNSRDENLASARFDCQSRRGGIILPNFARGEILIRRAFVLRTKENPCPEEVIKKPLFRPNFPSLAIFRVLPIDF